MDYWRYLDYIGILRILQPQRQREGCYPRHDFPDNALLQHCYSIHMADFQKMAYGAACNSFYGCMLGPYTHLLSF